MSRRYKLDEDELRAKRVFSKINYASKSAYNYKRKNQNSKENSPKKYNPRSKEAVIKITGKSTNLDAFKRHIEYITREYTLPLFDDEGNIYKGEEDIKDYIKLYNIDGAIPEYEYSRKKERNEVMNLVFSMKEHNTTPADKLMRAVVKTIKDKYPNNPACFSFHGDTDNPHIHCDLRLESINGERLYFKHKDRYELRQEYAKNLRDLGIKAYATSRNQSYGINKNIIIKNEEEKIKNHHYEVVEFGNAKYKFDESAKDSFFVKYKSKNGDIVDIWSEDLERVVKENDIKVGEFVRFKIVDKLPITVKAKRLNKKTNKWTIYTKQSLKNVWDCSIQDRLEKDLKTLKNGEIKKVTYGIETSENEIVDSVATKKPFVLNQKSVKKGIFER